MITKIQTERRKKKAGYEEQEDGRVEEEDKGERTRKKREIEEEMLGELSGQEKGKMKR